MENIIVGTIVVLGDDIPKEVRCPYKCGDADVSVNTQTGICSVCKRRFKINKKDIIVGPIPASPIHE